MSLLDDIVSDSGGRAREVAKVSMYDVRKFEVGRDFPPGHKIVEVCTVPAHSQEKCKADLGCVSRFGQARKHYFLILRYWS